MKQKESLDKLNKIIDQKTRNDGGMLYRNTFSLVCYLSLKEEYSASDKLLTSLFDELGYGNNKGYFERIKNSIAEFASEYTFQINANAEIDRLQNK